MAEIPAAAQQPTRLRYLVVFSCMLMAVLLYLDRFCVGIAEPYIKQDLGLSLYQMGFFFSAFFLTYALFQVPSGWMTDRYGARIMLTIYVLAWSFFTAMMGLSYGFVMLILMRAAYGLGQAGAYPTSASIISKWVPFSARGTASSIVAFGGRLGGAIAPLLTAFLIVLFVPPSRSSLFEAREMLKPDKLCFDIAPAPESSESQKDSSAGKNEETAAGDVRSAAARRVWEMLDEKSRRFVARIAAAYRPQAAQIAQLEKEAQALKEQRFFAAARDKMKQADSLRLKLSPEERQLLADALNGVIHRTDFYRPKHPAFREILLDRAGKKLRRHVDAGETLSEEENQRLNRLLLEKIFPDALGNIYVAGWRPVMISYGLLGLLVAGLLWFVLRNRPEEHPRCNAAEQNLIAASRPAGAPSPHGKTGGVPWRPLLTSGSMWMNCISQVGTNIGWIFILTWFPRYLKDVHQVGILDRGVMTSVPMMVGWAGMLLGGRLTDFLVRKVGLKWGRRLPWGGSRVLGITAFVVSPLLDSPWAVTAAMAVAAFSTDLGSPSVWAFCQDVGGRYVGSVLGWGNMWGNLGATVGPILLAWVIADYGYTTMFHVCAAAFVLSGVCGLGIDATKPIAPPEEEQN